MISLDWLSDRISHISPRFGLLGALAGGLLAISLHFQAQAGLTSFQITTLLFTFALFLRLHRKGFLHHPPSRLMQGLGVFFLLLILGIHYGGIVSINPYTLPLLFGCSFALIAISVKKLKKYYTEFGLLCLLSLPVEPLVNPLNNFLGISQGMAKFSTFLLWYVGFNVSNQSDYIILPERATWIDPNCTGVATLLWMLQLALLFLALYPTSRLQKIIVPLVALSLVVIVNGIRLAFLAIFAAHHPTLFEYWHSDNAQIFSTIPIVLFAWFGYWLNERNQKVNG